MNHRQLWLPPLVACVAAMLSSSVLAQDIVTIKDLVGKDPIPLSRDQLLALMPGARMSRVNEKGNTHLWSNEADGEMVVSSDNRGGGRRAASTAQGKWHVSDDGQFCMQVEWKKSEAEDSCRFILKTTDGYYAVNALKPDTRKAYKVTITR